MSERHPLAARTRRGPTLASTTALRATTVRPETLNERRPIRPCTVIAPARTPTGASNGAHCDALPTGEDEGGNPVLLSAPLLRNTNRFAATSFPPNENQDGRRIRFGEFDFLLDVTMVRRSARRKSTSRSQINGVGIVIAVAIRPRRNCQFPPKPMLPPIARAPRRSNHLSSIILGEIVYVRSLEGARRSTFFLVSEISSNLGRAPRRSESRMTR